MTSLISVPQEIIEHPIQKCDDFILIGTGEKGKNCEKIIPKLSCQSCHKTHFIKSSCMQKQCPNCWEKWVKKRTPKIVMRLLSNNAQLKNGGKRRKHIIISPPEDLWNIPEYELRERTISYLYKKSSKPPSGILIFHAFRFNDKGNHEYKLYIKECKEMDKPDKLILKKWEWLKRQLNYEEYITFSPHYHFIGYVGWMDKPIEEEGFIYKTILRNEKVALLNNKNDVYVVVYYLLSHGATKKIGEYHHTYTWIGNLADRNGTSKEEIELKEKMRENSHELMKKNAKCKSCKEGALWYLDQNLRAFLRAWCEITKPEEFTLQEKIAIVKIIKDIPPYIKQNVIEGLELIGGKPPPPGYEEYLI